MSDILHHLKKTLFTVGSLVLILPLASVSAFAQAEQSTANGGNQAVESSTSITGNGSQLLIGDIPIDGDFSFEESDVSIVVSGGLHTINGNVQINGSGDSVIIEFDDKKGHGHVKVNGTLILGPDNAPILGIDLSKVNLSRGTKFVLADATAVVGEFYGLSNGSTFTVGEYTFRILYTGSSITLVVVSGTRRFDPFVTPVTELDVSLVFPTSTGPTQ